MLICEFITQSDAEAALQQINTRGIELYTAEGYDIVSSDVYYAPGIKSLTTWDIVRQSPDNTYFFRHPSDKFPNHANYLLDGLSFTTKEIPNDWYPNPTI